VKRTYGSVANGTREIQVDVYFDKTGGADEFIARAVSYVKAEGQNKYSLVMKFQFTYSATKQTPPGLLSFSKYALFMDSWPSYLWFGHEHYDGMVYSNGNVQFLFKDARFYKELTYVGSEVYYWGWSWSQAEKDAMFPGGKSQVAKITMPTFQDVKTDVKPIAQAGPPELNIDPTASSPNPWSGLTFDTVKVFFVWDNVAKQNYAYLQAYNGGSVVKTVRYSIPKTGDDTLIYSTKKIHLKGIVQGRVTVTTESSNTTVTNPSVRITDDVVYVDDQGRPKTWVFTSGGNPLPASGRAIFTDPVSGQVFTYAFTGIPTAGNPAANNINTQTYFGTTVEWDQVNFIFKQNPNYQQTYKDPVLGMMSGGMFGVGREVPYNTVQNWAMYTPTSTYQVDEDGSPRGNYAKYGSVIVGQTPQDGTYYGWNSWTGYGRELPHVYDQHLLTTPPPYFVKLPGAGQQGPTLVDYKPGPTYVGTNY
jgi:hypothetical protein